VLAGELRAAGAGPAASGRLSFCLYNTPAGVDRAVAAVATAGPPPRLIAVPGRLHPSGASWPGWYGLTVWGVIRQTNTVILNYGES
jgi:hypothetical protein